MAKKAKKAKKTVSSKSGSPKCHGDWKKLKLSKNEIVEDYRVCAESRHASVIGRREVLTGKAKFGIFGDGKEVAQVSLSHSAEPGDFRSGYYRCQTLMFKLGISNIRQFFAQLYAHPDVEADPASAGRQMNAHYASRLLNPDGTWKNLTEKFNSSADFAPVSAQMSRLVGLAYASRLYRELKELNKFKNFSKNGNEIAWGMIGNAGCAEGVFWEAVNAIGVLKSPSIISIWDDGYGISVPNEYQVTKESLGEMLSGFQRTKSKRDGFDIYTVHGWDYPGMIEAYRKASAIARKDHVPAIVYVDEVTQPLGHSTSGSHERYKSKERMQFEVDYDANLVMRNWMIAQGIAAKKELDEIDEEAFNKVSKEREEAFNAYRGPIREEREKIASLIEEMAGSSGNAESLTQIKDQLLSLSDPLRKDVMIAAKRALVAALGESSEAKENLIEWKRAQAPIDDDRYASHLYSESEESALNVDIIPPQFSPDMEELRGFEILNRCFDAALARDPRVIAFGEDVGKLGDVNQAFAGLQSKYGGLRVSDTGIRECTIVGQAIGMALRGLRPIAEIQYLDYLLYALEIMSDDIATLQWRTKGGQKVPLIIRTRGHRLEGIWHSGSPMSGITNLIHGIRVLVPRNMTQAAGFYNTMLKSDEPALIVEVLNGYRLKEKAPSNIGEFTVPIGVPETLREGKDITIVTYGACCSIVLEAADILQEVGIDAEVIDVQSLLPFDINRKIVDSVKKTNRVLFVDEDVPGGATAYMMQNVLETQGGYDWLDSPPRTLSGTAHRPCYGTDGNYWSKPSAETIFEAAYEILREAKPDKFPPFYDF